MKSPKELVMVVSMMLLWAMTLSIVGTFMPNAGAAYPVSATRAGYSAVSAPAMRPWVPAGTAGNADAPGAPVAGTAGNVCDLPIEQIPLGTVCLGDAISVSR